MFLDYPVTKCSRNAVYRSKDFFSWFQRVHHSSEGRTKKALCGRKEMELQKERRQIIAPGTSPQRLLSLSPIFYSSPSLIKGNIF